LLFDWGKALDAGADVNERFQLVGGGTALHFAVGEDHKEIIKLLIAEGADVNAQSDYGTPLDYAIVGIQTFDSGPEVADLLRKHGGKTGAELKAEGK
jgi:ankyrin repeat protein